MAGDIDEMPPELLAGLDRFIDGQDAPPNPRLSRQEAVGVIVRDWLQAQGYLALPDGERVVPVKVAADLPQDG